MSNSPRLAQRYAKSLIDLATELHQLDEVREDMLVLQSVLNNRDFVLMLDSPIIKSDKKNKIIKAITGGKISKTTDVFLQLLCNKNRESNLPGVVSSFLMQYNTIKGLHNAKITTASPLGEELYNSFISKIKTSSSIDHLKLETVVDENIIGGFILEMEGKLIDASILRDLNDVKKQFANNDYIHKLR